MEREPQRGKSPMLIARVPHEVAAQVQEVADREFDGNVSMLVRIAVKRFIEERAPEVVATDTDLKVA
jgi:predicted DNA-binding ribbon-helix-helix protein